jgi:histidinol-phosphate aminotransferase
MSVSRRRFLGQVGVGSAAFGLVGTGALPSPLVSARGREALWSPQGQGQGAVDPGAARRADRRLAAAPGIVRIDSNENPVGPGAKAIDAIRAHFDESNRYPVIAEDELMGTIARLQGVAPENVMLGCGSGELLRAADNAFLSKSAAYVMAGPTFEAPGDWAKFMGVEVRSVPVGRTLGLDLEAMAAASKGAGLVYICNPNNPTATVHSKADVTAFIEQVNRTSPDTTILVDEAYFEYVDAAGYGTVIPVAVQNPRVVVLRTFSKVFGMAGLRAGYAIGRPETLAKIKAWTLGSNISQLTLVAANAALQDSEHIANEVKRNREVKAFTRKFFADNGFTMTSGDANFMMVDIRQDATTFKKAALKKGIAIGRAFPPLTTQARITFGTMPEMKKAVGVFRELLIDGTKASGGR